jgi:hypothetical protein
MEKNHMRVRLCVAAVGILIGMATSSAEAQVRFAPQVSYGDDADLGVGGRVNFGLSNTFGSPGFFGTASFDYFFPGNDVNYWELNGNIGWAIPGVRGNVKPYVGSGLNYGHVSIDNCSGAGCGDSDVGLNLMGGLNFMTQSKVAPFLEARLELGGGEQFVLTGGLYF